MVSLAAAEEAIELADAYGVCDGFPLAESQKLTLRNAGGERADGSWAATRVADFGPRQGTGKNDKIAAWELAHLLLFGTELIIHTAHEFRTANESFLRLVAMFENWDDLGKKMRRPYYGNGTQSIVLKSGQRIIYGARTGGAGRGFAKAGLLVYDEAQHLVSDQIAASGPTKMANPNSQTWYAGSGGLATSTVAWKMRRQAILGAGGRLAYTEMTGETFENLEQLKFTAPDPLDRDVWYRCIPGLGRWITEEAVEAQYEELGPEAFAREILCVWDPDPSDGVASVWPAGVWEAVCSPDAAQPTAGLVFAVDVNPERTAASIAVAGGGGSCGLLECRPGVGWAVDEVVRMARTHGASVAITSNGPAATLIADVEREGITVVALPAAQMRDACGLFFDAVVEHKTVVRRHAALDAAVKAAVKKTSGDAWVWDRRADGDVSPLVAVTAAFYVATTRVADPMLMVG